MGDVVMWQQARKGSRRGEQRRGKPAPAAGTQPPLQPAAMCPQQPERVLQVLIPLPLMK